MADSPSSFFRGNPAYVAILPPGPTTTYQDFASATSQATRLINDPITALPADRVATLGIKSLIKGSGFAGGPHNASMLQNLTAVKWAEGQDETTAWLSPTLVAAGEIDPLWITFRQGGPDGTISPSITNDAAGILIDGRIAGNSGYSAAIETGLAAVAFNTGVITYYAATQMNVVDPRDNVYHGFNYVVSTGTANYGVILQGSIDKPFYYTDNTHSFTVDGNAKITVNTTGATDAFSSITSTNHGISLTDGTVIGAFSPNSLLTHSIAFGSQSNHPAVMYANNDGPYVTAYPSGSVAIGKAAVATNATAGFLYIPTCAGTPTGTPTAITGHVAMVYDTTNHQFWFYDGGWKQPKTPAGAALVTWQ